MLRRYYSSRTKGRSLSVSELYQKIVHTFGFFQSKDYFKQYLDITENSISDSARQIAGVALTFCPFPVDKWPDGSLADDSLFDFLEFLFDHVSKPGDWVPMSTETGYDYHDYEDYDRDAGQADFRSLVNVFLCDYRDGYELSDDGMILSLDKELAPILTAEVIPFDPIHVDNKVNLAIRKWRNRHLDLSERKQAIRELADVFEWLRKNRDLSKVLHTKDESDLFNIANNFHIRHHNPKQLRQYDEKIWCSWMFHFYLATYHATIRLIQRNDPKNPSAD